MSETEFEGAPQEFEQPELPAEEAPAAEPWTGVTQEQWTSLDTTTRQLAESQAALMQLIYQSQQQPAEQAAPEIEIPDMYEDPAGYADARQELFMQQVRSELAPMQELQREIVHMREQAAQDMMLGQAQGYNEMPDGFKEMARQMGANAAQSPQFANYPAAGYQAAVNYINDQLRQYAEQAVAKSRQTQGAEQQRLQNIAGAPTSPPPGAGGVEQAWGPHDDEVTLARRWRERMRAAGE